MKRWIMAALCLVVAASGAFALDKTVGGGILYNAGFSNGSISQTINTGYSSTSYNADWTMSRNGFGAFGFFGLSQFAELNLGLMYKNPSDIEASSNGQKSKVSASQSGIESTAALQLGIYGKYPIPISDLLVFFPTGGLDVEITLASKEENASWEWWHDIWIRGGVGLDFFLSEKMFLRGHLLYGAAIPVGGSSELGLTVGHGLLVKAGIGFML